MTPGPRLLTVHQVATETGWSVWTIRDLIADGRLPSVRPPGIRRVFVDRRDLERAIVAWKGADPRPETATATGISRGRLATHRGQSDEPARLSSYTDR